jgi:hypothetical protein
VGGFHIVAILVSASELSKWAAGLTITCPAVHSGGVGAVVVCAETTPE